MPDNASNVIPIADAVGSLTLKHAKGEIVVQDPLSLALSLREIVDTETEKAKAAGKSGPDEREIWTTLRDRVKESIVSKDVNGQDFPLNLTAIMQVYEHCQGWLDRLGKD